MRTKQARKTARRKIAQAEARYIEALRREATLYEGVHGHNVRGMSKEALERIMKTGKRRRGITGVGHGMPLAMAAARLLTAMERKN